MNDTENTRQRLFEAMRGNKKTVQDVAAMTDICSDRIRAYLSGADDLELNELEKLSKCLKISFPL